MKTSTTQVAASELRYLSLFFAGGRRQRFRVSAEEADRVAGLFRKASSPSPEMRLAFTGLGDETFVFERSAIIGVAVRPLLTPKKSEGISLLALSEATGLSYQTLRGKAEKDKNDNQSLTWVSERKLATTRENFEWLGLTDEQVRQVTASTSKKKTSKKAKK